MKNSRLPQNSKQPATEEKQGRGLIISITYLKNKIRVQK